MAKQLKLQCWNCPRIYFYSIEENSPQEVIVSCPYCRTEGVVDLRPSPDATKAIYKGGENNDWMFDEFDEAFPTRERK